MSILINWIMFYSYDQSGKWHHIYRYFRSFVLVNFESTILWKRFCFPMSLFNYWRSVFVFVHKNRWHNSIRRKLAFWCGVSLVRRQEACTFVCVLQDALYWPVEQDEKANISRRTGRDRTTRTRPSDRAGQKDRSGPKNWSCDSLWSSRCWVSSSPFATLCVDNNQILKLSGVHPSLPQRFWSSRSADERGQSSTV